MNEFEPRLTRALGNPYSRSMPDGTIHHPEGIARPIIPPEVGGRAPDELDAMRINPDLAATLRSVIPADRLGAFTNELMRRQGERTALTREETLAAKEADRNEKNELLDHVRTQIKSRGNIHKTPEEAQEEIEEEENLANNAIVDRQITEDTYRARARILIDRKFRDEVFNNIFATVDANPSEFWDRAFNYYTHGLKVEAYMTMILNGSMNRDDLGFRMTEADRLRLSEDFYRYQNEIQVRKTLHDLNAILYLPSIKGDQLYDSLQQFGGLQGDIAVRLPGVTQMMDIYEQVLREKMAGNAGTLTPEDIRGQVISTGDRGQVLSQDDDPTKVERVVYVGKSEAENLTRKRFESLMKAGQITTVDEQDGRSYAVSELKPWEIDRVFTTARGMMIANERLLSLAAESKLPVGASRYMSSWMQDVLQQYSPYIHLLGKYSITEKALTAYLYSDFEKNGLNELKHALHRLEHFGLDILNGESFDSLRYLTRQNPNRAGDIFTWVSWRVANEPDTMSFVQRFLEKGMGRMQGRFNRPDDISQSDWENEYSNWIGTGIRFEKMRGDLQKIKEFPPTNHEQQENLHKATELLGQMAKFQPHRLYLVSDDIRARINERVFGEGSFRDEIEKRLAKVRKDFDDPNSEEFKEKFKGMSRKEIDEFRHEREIIAFKQGRLALDKDKQTRMETISGNLLAIESSILNRREGLLSGEDPICKGKPIVFKNLNIEDFIREDMAKPEDQRIIKNIEDAKDALKLASLVSQDYKTESGKSDSENKYISEFVKNREYKHGFVLWTGDARMDEYNFMDVHDTGAFARRARDNKSQGEAAAEEIKLLEALPKLQNMEQLAEGLEKIWEKLGHYDGPKASTAIMEKALGFAWLFKERPSSTYTPVFGALQRRTTKDSMARVLWGKSALSVGPADINHLFSILRDHEKITEAQFNYAREKLDSGMFWLALDTAVNIGQLGLLGFLIYMFSKTVELPKSH